MGQTFSRGCGGDGMDDGCLCPHVVDGNTTDSPASAARQHLERRTRLEVIQKKQLIRQARQAQWNQAKSNSDSTSTTSPTCGRSPSPARDKEASLLVHRATMRLALDFGVVSASSMAREAFAEGFRQDMADAIGCHPVEIMIDQLRAGSVIADFTLLSSLVGAQLRLQDICSGKAALPDFSATAESLGLTHPVIGLEAALEESYLISPARAKEKLRAATGKQTGSRLVKRRRRRSDRARVPKVSFAPSVAHECASGDDDDDSADNREEGSHQLSVSVRAMVSAATAGCHHQHLQLELITPRFSDNESSGVLSGDLSRGTCGLSPEEHEDEQGGEQQQLELQQQQQQQQQQEMLRRSTGDENGGNGHGASPSLMSSEYTLWAPSIMEASAATAVANAGVSTAAAAAAAAAPAATATEPARALEPTLTARLELGGASAAAVSPPTGLGDEDSPNTDLFPAMDISEVRSGQLSPSRAYTPPLPLELSSAEPTPTASIRRALFENNALDNCSMEKKAEEKKKLGLGSQGFAEMTPKTPQHVDAHGQDPVADKENATPLFIALSPKTLQSFDAHGQDPVADKQNTTPLFVALSRASDAVSAANALRTPV